MKPWDRSWYWPLLLHLRSEMRARENQQRPQELEAKYYGRALRHLLKLWLLTAFAATYAQAGPDDCRAKYNAAMKQCLGQVNDISLVAGRIRKCRSLYDEKYRGCSNQAPAGDAGSCNREEAKVNIDWVLFRDGGARATYLSYRRRGQNPVDAIISAQGHNPHAQQTIRDCYAWAQNYVSKEFASAPASNGQGAAPREEWEAVRKDADRETARAPAPQDASYRKYWDFSCSVTWWTTLRTGGIVPGLCEEDSACEPLLQYWRQTPQHIVFKWTQIASTDPQGIATDVPSFAQRNALDNARRQLAESDFHPVAERVADVGWGWELIDPRSGEYDSGETYRCENRGLKEWRTR